MIRVAHVKFNIGEKIYGYRFEDMKLKKGDLVIVKSGNPYGYGLATVQSVSKEKETSDFPDFVIEKVDMEKLDEVAAYLESRQARRAELLEMLDDRLKEAEELSRYEKLAAADPAAAVLLKELMAM